MVVMPITVDDEWWGFIGFDHCAEERTWHQAEIDALTVAANTLGAAIGRERAERRISETETRYRSLVEQIPAITYIAEPGTGRTIYISPQLETVLGYTREEMKPELYWASLHPDDRSRILAEDERTNRTGEPYRVQYRQRAKDGRWVWIRDEALLVHDERGNPLYWQGVRFDITAQKETEQQVREAEERYRTLIETVPAVTYIDTVSEPVQSVFVSPQIRTMLGFTPEEWVGDPDLWWDHLDPAFLAGGARGRDPARVRRAVRRRVPLPGQGRQLALDPRSGARRDRRRRNGPVLPGRDDRHHRREAGRGAVARRRAAVPRDRRTHPGRRVPRSPGVARRDPLREPRARAHAGDRRRGVGARRGLVGARDPSRRPRGRRAGATSRSCEQEGQWTREYRFVARDGRTVWVRDEASILRDEDGRPSFVQGVWFDITERKLAEDALRESEGREREAAERLRSLDEMKNTFLAAVSHELRSPLTSILGLSLTLERQRELDDEDREDLLERLSTNARKLDRLLKDLLDIDRLSRGIVTPQYRVVDVAALVRRSADSLDTLAHRAVEVETSPVVISVDPAKVERIVENLLVNAARHTLEDRRIWLRVMPHDGGVLIAVEDDGAGVPVELRDAIFEPFRQGPTVQSHSPGTGIGLSLVSRFAALHGGRAWVEDREGGGASFRVFLPGGPTVGAAGDDPGGAGGGRLDRQVRRRRIDSGRRCRSATTTPRSGACTCRSCR